MKICDEDGNDLAVGEQGEVWMRSKRDTPKSLGDIGWLDADGYLYLGDRVADMILSERCVTTPAS